MRVENLALLAVVFAISTAACSLELAGKNACNTHDDCLDGRVCVAGTCRAPTPRAPDVGDDGAVSPSFTPRFGLDRAAGEGRRVASSGTDTELAAEGLLALVPSSGVLTPPFDPAISEYSLELSSAASEVSLTPRIRRGARVTLLEQELTSDVASSPIALSLAHERLELAVQVGSGEARRYTVDVQRCPDVRGLVLKPQPELDSGGAIYGVGIATSGGTIAVSNYQSVDVYRESASGYVQEAHLTARGGRSDDSFGVSLALAGDRLVVGAWGEDSAARGPNGDRDNDEAPDSGAAYVYVREQGVWREEAYLKPDNTAPYQWFGMSVALDGNVIAVGSPSEGGAGAAYAFELERGAWRQTAYVKLPQGDVGNGNSELGWRLALSGDVLAVSAANEAVLAADGSVRLSAGAVYLLERRDGSWHHLQRLEAPNPDTNDAFGTGLALAGGLLAIGAPQEDGADNAVENSGAVFVYERAPAGFALRAYLKADQPRLGGIFGSSVALRGATLAVGEWAESRRDGSAYLFGLAERGWSQHLRVDARMARGNVQDDGLADTFGSVVTLSDRALFVGAPFERPFGQEVGIGAAYRFE